MIITREAIDALDTQIMALLEKRFELSKTIGKNKVLNDKVIHDPIREQSILKCAENYENHPSIHAVYLTIFEESRALQNEIRTAR